MTVPHPALGDDAAAGLRAEVGAADEAEETPPDATGGAADGSGRLGFGVDGAAA